jgi:hypothetical protein
MNRFADFLSAAGRASLAPLLGLAVLAPLMVLPASGQMRFTYNKGQSVEPAYEGWMQEKDGSYTLYFGYMNPNWQEQLDVNLGPENNIQPGGPDQGQPTHFYPRRNPFLFTVKVPKDFGAKELVWTLTSNGKTNKAHGTLSSDYQIDPQVMSTEIGGDGGSLRDELRYNLPPELEIEGDARRSVKVGEPMRLVLLAGDPDNLPSRRDKKPQPRHAGMPAVDGDTTEGAVDAKVGGDVRVLTPSYAGPDSKSSKSAAKAPAAAARPRTGPAPGYAPPSSVVVADGPGLWTSWIVYRGKASTVKFNPEVFKAWMDSRAWANSAWSPPYVIPEPPKDGKWITQVTFSEPGTYTLRAVASDGSLFTFQNMVVTVTP